MNVKKWRKNGSRVVWMLKNGDMWLRKIWSWSFWIQDGYLCSAYHLTTQNLSKFLNFLSSNFSEKKNKIFTCKMKNSHFRYFQKRRLFRTEFTVIPSRVLIRTCVGGSTWWTWNWVSTWWDGLLESTLFSIGVTN